MTVTRWGRLLGSALIAATLLAAAAPGHAQRRMTVIVPYGPGGSVDQIARTFADLLRDEYQWIVVNRPGGGGNTAQRELMRAKPDGQTIMFTVSGYMLQPFVADVPWKSPADFTSIAIVADSPTAHFVRANSPHKSLHDLIAHSKRNPGKVVFGVTGLTTASAVRVLHLKELAGVEWTVVPYPSDNDVVVAALGGHIETGTVGLAAVTAHVRSGALRLIAVPEEDRLPAFPDVPTFRELGYPLVYPNYMIIVAPKDTPAEHVEPLRRALQKAVTTNGYRRFIEASGMLPITRFGTELDRTLNDQFETFRSLAPKLPKQ